MIKIVDKKRFIVLIVVSLLLCMTSVLFIDRLNVIKIVLDGQVFSSIGKIMGNRVKIEDNNGGSADDNHNIGVTAKHIVSDVVSNGDQEAEGVIYFGKNYRVNIPYGWYVDIVLTDGAFGNHGSTSEEYKSDVEEQLFISNYTNIEEYSPENKPSDLHIIALTVYRDNFVDSIEKFAKKIGFEVDYDKVDFLADNIRGEEFVSPGETIGNPNVAIIFRQGELFYVFDLEFIGGDFEVAEQMEDIVSTFSVNSTESANNVNY